MNFTPMTVLSGSVVLYFILKHKSDLPYNPAAVSSLDSEIFSEKSGDAMLYIFYINTQFGISIQSSLFIR